LPYPSRTSLKLVAVLFGILVAGAPIILFNAWLKRQGDDEASVAAAWAQGTVETRIGQSIATLQDLSARGVDSCKPAHVEAMRQTALLTTPIKQVMLIAPNGDALCTDASGPAARQEVLATAPRPPQTSCWR
jgi:sensor c-di-GMP phosphodiesterase-like protein